MSFETAIATPSGSIPAIDNYYGYSLAETRREEPNTLSSDKVVIEPLHGLIDIAQTTNNLLYESPYIRGILNDDETIQAYASNVLQLPPSEIPQKGSYEYELMRTSCHEAIMSETINSATGSDRYLASLPLRNIQASDSPKTQAWIKLNTARQDLNAFQAKLFDRRLGLNLRGQSDEEIALVSKVIEAQIAFFSIFAKDSASKVSKNKRSRSNIPGGIPPKYLLLTAAVILVLLQVACDQSKDSEGGMTPTTYPDPTTEVVELRQPVVLLEEAGGAGSDDETNPTATKTPPTPTKTQQPTRTTSPTSSPTATTTPNPPNPPAPPVGVTLPQTGLPPAAGPSATENAANKAASATPPAETAPIQDPPPDNFQVVEDDNEQEQEVDEDALRLELAQRLSELQGWKDFLLSNPDKVNWIINILTSSNLRIVRVGVELHTQNDSSSEVVIIESDCIGDAHSGTLSAVTGGSSGFASISLFPGQVASSTTFYYEEDENGVPVDEDIIPVSFSEEQAMAVLEELGYLPGSVPVASGNGN